MTLLKMWIVIEMDMSPRKNSRACSGTTTSRSRTKISMLSWISMTSDVMDALAILTSHRKFLPSHHINTNFYPYKFIILLII